MARLLKRDRVVLLRRVLIWLVRGLGVCAAGAVLIGGYYWATTDLPTLEQLRARAGLSSSQILDRHGRLLYQIPYPNSGRQTVVPLNEIPLELQHATIAIEDRDFYRNPGIKLSAMLRSAWINLRSGSAIAGGSTITQQVARNLLLDPGVAQRRTLDRKLREIVLALKLNRVYSKEAILGLYLNQTYYGRMSYGVEDAARHIFGKPVRDLSLAEAALLAGLPQAPSAYDPFGDPAAARARQAEVLEAMVRSGFITPEQAAAARAERLRFDSDGEAMRAPHFVHYVIDQLSAELGIEPLTRGGLRITTTLDLDLQDAAQLALRRQIDQLSGRAGQPDHHVRNGAVVVLEPSSGAILAMVGSPNFDDAAIQGQVNGALAPRQPGSAIKPLTYAAALERGWTPATILLDIPSSFPTREGRPYLPENYDRVFHGPLSLREALATSSNVAAVRALDAIGIPALLDMAARLGITTFGRDAQQYGPALALGSGEVNLLELTAAYAAFANGGRQVQPVAILGVTDSHARGVGRWGAAPDALAASAQRVSPQVAYLITDILSDRLARARAFGAVSALDLDRPAAVKTGTTTGWRDNWTIGYTPFRAVGVWIGNADGQPMEDVTGLTGAAPVWHDVMQATNGALPPAPFDRPSGIVELPICAEGGMLPSPTCPGTRLERFMEGTQPTRADDTHVLVRINPLLNCRAPEGYPPEWTVERIFRVLPAESQAWADAAGLPRAPSQVCAGPTPSAALPPDSPVVPAAPGTAPTGASALIAPAPGAVFRLSPGVPRDRQRIELRAQAGTGAIRLTIVVDGAPVATFDRPPYRALWQLAPGTHHALIEVQGPDQLVWRSSEIEFVVQE